MTPTGTPLLLAVGLSVALLGCSSSAPSSKAADSTVAPAARPVPSAEVLAQGHDLFTQKCGTCHALPDPASHKAEKWPHLVEWMRQRSNLDTAQASKVLDWVLAERGRLTTK